MYIKYKLVKRDGWGYVCDVARFEALNISLKESEWANWSHIDIIETVNVEDGKFLEVCSDGESLFLFINAKKKDGSSQLLLLDPRCCYLCNENGGTAQRLA